MNTTNPSRPHMASAGHAVPAPGNARPSDSGYGPGSPSPYGLDERAARAAGAVRRGEELRLPCPVHDSSPETLALRLAAGRPLWHCHAGCDAIDVRDALLARGILVRGNRAAGAPAYRAVHARPVPSWVPQVWGRAGPLDRTPAEDYLRRRRLVPPWPHALRWDAARGRMLARVTLDGVLRGLHTTRLPERERRTHGPVGGGVIRLSGFDATLALAEGIETAMAYERLTGTPTWAALSSAGMASAVLPGDLATLVIAADFDGPGLVAAERLEVRARAAGIDVRIDLPARYRTDWADVLGAAYLSS